MSAKTEHATHLFGAYFHQDCLQDEPDWESIVLRFRRSEPFDVVRTTQIELEALLERTDEKRGPRENGSNCKGVSKRVYPSPLFRSALCRGSLRHTDLSFRFVRQGPRV